MENLKSELGKCGAFPNVGVRRHYYSILTGRNQSIAVRLESVCLKLEYDQFLFYLGYLLGGMVFMRSSTWKVHLAALSELRSNPFLNLTQKERHKIFAELNKLEKNFGKIIGMYSSKEKNEPKGLHKRTRILKGGKA